MKKIYLVIFLAFSISGVIAQTNPPAQTLPYTQDFGTTTFTALPAGWAAWNGINGATVTSLATAQASSPSGNATITAQTGATTTGGAHGLANASNARPYIQTSSNATNGVNQIAMAINTSGFTNISITYDVEIISAQPRTVGIVMQYRLGTSGGWTTVSGTGNPFSQAGGTAGIQANASLVLPAAADNQPVVQLRWATWRGTETGNSSGIAIDNVNISGTSAGIPDIALSSANPAVPAGNISEGITNQVIYQFDLTVTTNSAALNGLTINTSGTYTAITDLINFKAWLSADNIFDAGSDILLGTEFAAAPGAQVFSPFASQSINTGTTVYIFITTDVPCAATVGNTVSVNAVTTADVSFVNGNESGAAFAGGTQTIAAGTPLNVTGAGASTGNNESTVNWTNPLACYNEIMIVASSGSANSGTPIGDGTAYTADLAFGNGTALGNGFVVYKGTLSPQTVTALSNGTQYYFKIFTRLGTLWSSGVEVNATPANVTTATDYFRSRATGAWNAASTWESSPDNSTWIMATLAPTTAANTVTIRNDDTVTVTSATSVDQVIIQSGGVLINTAALTIADDAGTADDLLIQSGGIWTLSVAGAPGGTGTIRNQTGGMIRVSATGTIQLLQTTRYIYENASVLEYTLTSTFGASGVTYFPNVDAVTIPIFRATANIPSAIGGGSNTVINGLFEANGTVNFTGAGTKTFRNGISGTGNISQGASGAFLITGIAELGGTGVITLGATGLEITSTSLTTIELWKTIDAGTITVNGVLDGPIFTQIRGTGNIVINGTLRTEHPDGISLTGTLANTGTKVLGTSSTVAFYAGFPQQFTTGFTYANVEISGTDGGETLNGPVTVTGNLALLSGHVFTTSTNLLTLDINATFSGGNALSHVVGPLQRNTNSTSPYTFPVGSGAISLRSVDIIPASATGSSYIVEYFAPNINTTSPACNPVKLEAYTDNERWNVIRSAGADDAAVRLNYEQSISAGNWTNGTTAMPDPDNTKGITVAFYNTGSSCWDVNPDISTLVAGDAPSGQPATMPLNTFGDFTFGGAAFEALPVKIDFIEGAKQGGAHKITWKVTCNNTPTAVMSLERSTDARNYSSIYNITATAERCLQSFTYSDANPAAGVNYYRLRMTDVDGRSSYSATIALLNKDRGFDIVSISPNPVSTTAQLSISSVVNARMQLSITDIMGAVVSRHSVNLVAGSNISSLNLEKLPAGTYQITGSLPGEEVRTLRFIKR